MNSKLHAVGDGAGRPIRLHLTAGQHSDFKGADVLLPGLPPARVLIADRGYDRAKVRKIFEDQRNEACILADVERGLVDMIVVYKIDRLTQSLSDFAKLIDRLDAKQCSFVSVTHNPSTPPPLWGASH